MSLNTQSNGLADLGRREEALAVIEQAAGFLPQPRSPKNLQLSAAPAL